MLIFIFTLSTLLIWQPKEWVTLFVGLLNALVLLFIASRVENWESRRHKNSFIYDFYTDLTNELYGIQPETQSTAELEALKKSIDSSIQHKKFLFKEKGEIFTKKMKDLSDSISTLIEKIDEEDTKIGTRVGERIPIPEDLAFNLDESQQEETEEMIAFNNFEDNKKSVLEFIQSILS